MGLNLNKYFLEWPDCGSIKETLRHLLNTKSIYLFTILRYFLKYRDKETGCKGQWRFREFNLEVRTHLKGNKVVLNIPWFIAPDVTPDAPSKKTSKFKFES